MSVPFTLTGLTAGHTYHCVISAATTVTNQFQGVGIVEQYNGGTTFPGDQVSLSPTSGYFGSNYGYSIPIRVFNGNGGRLLHTMSDAGAGLYYPWTWLITDWAGKVLAIAEYQNSFRSWRQFNYDGFGTLTSLT